MRIYYHCYDQNRPTGGQKSTYQHVDALNRSGFEAAIVHTRPGFRLTWFENDTNVITWSEFWKRFDAARDYLVLPEDLGYRIAEYPGKKVIFNKGLFYGYSVLGLTLTGADPYLISDVVAAFSVSEHNANHLRFAYPHLPVHRVWEHVDNSVFSFRAFSEKRNQIAYVPKARTALATLSHVFRAHMEATGTSFRWVALEGRTERQMADVLAESRYVIFLSTEEGLGRTPLEALLAGCFVIAYDASPMDEYLPAAMRFRCGDLAGMVRTIEAHLNSSGERLHAVSAIIQEGRDAALLFSAERQQKSVCDAWNAIAEAGSSTPFQKSSFAAN